MLSYQQINVSGQRRPFSIMNSQDVTNVHKGEIQKSHLKISCFFYQTKIKLIRFIGQNDAQQNGQVLISVANLGKNITEKQIWEIFGPFGAVTNVTITRNNTEQEFLKEGNIATVTMPVYNEALCAINCINNREVEFINHVFLVYTSFILKLILDWWTKNQSWFSIRPHVIRL